MSIERNEIAEDDRRYLVWGRMVVFSLLDLVFSHIPYDYYSKERNFSFGHDSRHFRYIVVVTGHCAFFFMVCSIHFLLCDGWDVSVAAVAAGGGGAVVASVAARHCCCCRFVRMTTFYFENVNQT